MKMSALLARYRSLPGVLLLSLLLHALVLAWLDARLARTFSTPGHPALAVTLSLGSPTPPENDVVAAPPPPSELPAPDERPPQDLPPVPLTAAPASAESTTSLSAQAGDSNRAGRPRRYRVGLPPTARLDYRVTTRGADGQSREDGAARIDWHNDGERYRLDIDGVTGAMVSQGGMDDAGIAPERIERRSGSDAVSTVFDRSGGAMPLGSQDSATVLLQLASMGRADPVQMEGVIEFWVGDADSGRVERYQVMGEQTIASGIGELETLYLVRIGRSDEARVELWLAPQKEWLPVQLRVTAPSGAARTQTLAAIEIAPAPGG